jgi:hypothetical protein
MSLAEAEGNTHVNRPQNREKLGGKYNLTFNWRSWS